MNIVLATCGLWLAGTMSATPSVFAQSGKPELTLNDAVGIARERSDLVRSLAAQQRAAETRAGSAGELPDPVIQLGVNNLPVSGNARFKLDEQLPTAVSIGLRRQLTRRDKRVAKVDQFQTQATLTGAQADLALAKLSRETAAAWLERAITQELRDVTVERIEEDQRLLASAEAAFRSGRELQTGVFDARLAIERTRDRLDEIDRQLAITTVELRRWVGVDAARPSGLIPPLIWTQANARTEPSNPELRLAQARIDLNEVTARVAETATRADWTVGLSYGRRGSVFGDSVSVSLSIPWQLNRAVVQTPRWVASRELVAASEFDRRELMRSETSRIESLATSLRHLNKRIARYEHRILPLATQRSEAALAAYSGGNGSLSSVLLARRSQVDLQSEKIELRRRAGRIWAELAFLDEPSGLADRQTASKGEIND